MRREHMIRVRATKDELRALTAAARAAGLTLSAYLRFSGLANAQPFSRQKPRPSNALKTRRPR